MDACLGKINYNYADKSKATPFVRPLLGEDKSQSSKGLDILNQNVVSRHLESPVKE